VWRRILRPEEPPLFVPRCVLIPVMGRLIVSEFITLDGVIEAPGHEEHRDGKNAWALRGTSEDQQRYKIRELDGVDALLFGRSTYQIFAVFWPTAPRDEGFADRMNGIRKYVASTTLREAPWNNSVILRRDIPQEVARLKKEHEGDILIFGSADLVNSLMKHDVIDEFRLILYPVILGSGKHLFRQEMNTSHLRLVGTRAFTSGTVLLTYAVTPEAPSSEYVETFGWTEEQVRSMQAARDEGRLLATVLFTDILDSTGRAAALGDRRWREVLDRHDRMARAEVERFRGRLVKTTGDGILATFDAPTRALRCAFGLKETLASLDLRIRAAIHTGEIEIRGEDVGGIAVHIAARILPEAGDGRVIVTRTVRDLATGIDLVFAPVGTVGLRGVPGEWELFEASVG
jgi:class 3 adenylate cyclase/dihydrofolate reductase